MQVLCKGWREASGFPVVSSLWALRRNTKHTFCSRSVRVEDSERACGWNKRRRVGRGKG